MNCIFYYFIIISWAALMLVWFTPQKLPEFINHRPFLPWIQPSDLNALLEEVCLLWDFYGNACCYDWLLSAWQKNIWLYTNHYMAKNTNYRWGEWTWLPACCGITVRSIDYSNLTNILGYIDIPIYMISHFMTPLKKFSDHNQILILKSNQCN